MISRNGFGSSGTSIFFAALATAAVYAGGLAEAETVATVNGTSIDSTVLEVYIQSRVQNPGTVVNDEQRASMLDQLKDVYILSTQDAVTELEKDPIISARLQLQKTGVLAQAYIDHFIANLTISEQEITTTYAEQIKLAPTKQYKARHILVATQGEAVEIVEALIAGANFSELAKERSSDTSASSGGELDWFVSNQMVQPFSEAVMRLQDGRYTTDPVQSEFGWHVILREGSRDAEPPPLDSVREQIFAALQTQKLQDHIADLRTKAIQ